eukprot:232338-Amphidinium_carterae.1
MSWYRKTPDYLVMDENEGVEPEGDGAPQAPAAAANPDKSGKMEEPDEATGKKKVPWKKESLGDDAKPAAATGSGLRTYSETAKPSEPRAGINDHPSVLSAASDPLRAEVVGLESYLAHSPVKMGYHPVTLTNTGAELNTMASLTTTLQAKMEGESPNQYSNVRMSFGPRVCSARERTMNVSAKP